MLDILKRKSSSKINEEIIISFSLPKNIAVREYNFLEGGRKKKRKQTQKYWIERTILHVILIVSVSYSQKLIYGTVAIFFL